MLLPVLEETSLTSQSSSGAGGQGSSGDQGASGGESLSGDQPPLRDQVSTAAGGLVSTAGQPSTSGGQPTSTVSSRIYPPTIPPAASIGGQTLPGDQPTGHPSPLKGHGSAAVDQSPIKAGDPSAVDQPSFRGQMGQPAINGSPVKGQGQIPMEGLVTGQTPHVPALGQFQSPAPGSHVNQPDGRFATQQGLGPSTLNNESLAPDVSALRLENYPPDQSPVRDVIVM